MSQTEEADKIIEWLITETRIDRAAILKSKAPYISYIRYLACYLIREHTALEYNKIANLMGRHDRKIYEAVSRIKYVLQQPTNDNIEREILRLNKLYAQKYSKHHGQIEK